MHIDKQSIECLIFYLKRAKEINSIDIWPQYWISHFLTDKTSITGRKKDCKLALKAWNELVQNDLVFESPVQKLVYQKNGFIR